MSAVKEMRVTEHFLGLDEVIKKCQSKETFEECTTREYISAVQKKCDCVAYGLKSFTLQNQVREAPHPQ